MAALDSSIYEIVTIESRDQKRTVDLRAGVTSIDYYEDIFSPVITAKISVINTGNTVQSSDNEGNPDGDLQSIYQGLPIRGGEKVFLKIAGNSESNPGLDFASDPKKYWEVSGTTNIITESEKEFFTLNLYSPLAKLNEGSRVSKKYPTSSPISSSVEDILKLYLNVSAENIEIDKTSNKYGFFGNQKKPFSVLVWLASKAVSETTKENSSAGFVFYETVEGIKFKSIENLMSQDAKQQYVYTEVNTPSAIRDPDYDILTYTINKNENLIEKLRLGAFSSNRIYYNPFTFEISQQNFTSDEYIGKTNNLGATLEPPKLSSESNNTLGDMPSRIFTQILDIGTIEKAVSLDKNSDPMEYQSQSVMKYNQLFTQTLSMIIPSNTNLKAGDIIECLFPKTTISKKKEYDKDQSGLYMIKELCHHFDVSGSYTSMLLVRDTFGAVWNR